jgi:hypothetical protein
MAVKEKILNILHSIDREGMDKLIDWLENDSDFYTCPSSAKYHSNFEGGNAEHSLNVCELFKEKCERYNINIPINSIYICGIFHDLCKVNFYFKEIGSVKKNGKWTEEEIWKINDKFPILHGYKSVIMLQNFIRLSEFEILAISHHMGLPEDYVSRMAYNNAVEKYPAIVLLHSADLESSHILEKTIK